MKIKIALHSQLIDARQLVAFTSLLMVEGGSLKHRMACWAEPLGLNVSHYAKMIDSP